MATSAAAAWYTVDGSCLRSLCHFKGSKSTWRPAAQQPEQNSRPHHECSPCVESCTQDAHMSHGEPHGVVGKSSSFGSTPGGGRIGPDSSLNERHTGSRHVMR